MSVTETSPSVPTAEVLEEARAPGATSLGRLRTPRLPQRAGLQPWAWTEDLAAKRPVIAGYRTQVDALFPGGEIPLRPETYYARRGTAPGSCTTR